MAAMAATGTNAKSSNVRATAAFENIPDCLQLDHPVRVFPAIQRWSIDRAAGRQRVVKLRLASDNAIASVIAVMRGCYIHRAGY
jgi:hypothetical protein